MELKTVAEEFYIVCVPDMERPYSANGRHGWPLSLRELFGLRRLEEYTLLFSGISLFLVYREAQHFQPLSG